MAKIDAFFKLMNEQGASDLHLIAGQPPALRIRGDIERIKYKVLDNDDLRSMLYEITPEHKIKSFEETGDVDFAYEIPGLARYRANFFMQRRGVGAVFREIPSAIMNADQLGLPPVVSKLATLPRGLVLVTGPTGSGKSTTLAAMIVACVLLRRCGPLEGIFRDEHLHDLGKLLVGFSCFWMRRPLKIFQRICGPKL